MNLSGRWEGKLIDASGPMALVTLTLRSAGEAVAGDFEMAFVSLEDGCCGSGRQSSQVGSVKGKVDPKSGQVRLDYQVSIGLKPVNVRFTARVVKADPHARRAMLGCFDIAERDGPLSLEGGACVMWDFAQPVKKAARVGRAKKGA